MHRVCNEYDNRRPGSGRDLRQIAQILSPPWRGRQELLEQISCTSEWLGQDVLLPLAFWFVSAPNVCLFYRFNEVYFTLDIRWQLEIKFTQ